MAENESEVVKALREEFERQLKEQREKYENQIAEIKRDNVETIKTILTTGAIKLNDENEGQEVPTEEDEEETITKNLRKKLRIKGE